MAPEQRQGTGRHRRAKTPTLLQLEAVECGAAALGIVLAYHGRIVPLAALRRECGVSRDGSKASNMVKAARRYGMLAKGFTKEVDDLRDLKPPFIVFWSFNHFVVVEGFGKNKIHLNDPSTGHRTVPLDEFDRAFTGVVLVMEPAPGFRKEGRPRSVIRAIRARLRGAYLGIAYCILVGLLLVVPGLALPAFSQVFLDSVLIDRHVDWLRPLILAMLLAVLVQATMRLLQLTYLRRFRAMLAIRMASRFMWHMLRLPASFYGQRFAGDVASRSQLNDKLADVLSGRLAQTAIDAAMMVFYAMFMFYYDAVLTMVGLARAAANFLVLRWVAKRRVEANMRVLREYGKAEGTSMAGLQGIETIKSAGLESAFFATWAGHYTKASNARHDLELSNQPLTILPSTLTMATMAVVLTLGGMRIISGHLSIGMLVAFQMLMTNFLTPINGLLGLGSTFQELRGDLDRVDDVLDHPAAPTAPTTQLTDADGRQVVRLAGHVELRQVTFGYNLLEPPLLEDLDLVVRPGQRVALVGGSGSGKTTVARLISGELTPWDGQVLFDHVPRQEIPLQVLVNSFNSVDQEISLFGASVRENLTLWDNTLERRSLVRACEDAAIHDTILELPGSYESQLLEGGANLSGGQRQRLEIARALVNDPAILVLDEATSTLDAETEWVIMERLRMRGCSCLIVAHRLSTIRDCDEIIVLEEGRVVERGTHDELWAASGHYARLLESDVPITIDAT